MSATQLTRAVDELADPVAAASLERYFQVRPGGDGEGDVFAGVRLSTLWQVARPFVREAAPLSARMAELTATLRSPVHEHRLIALVVATEDAKRATRHDDQQRLRVLHDWFVANLDHVDNWDLVDLASEHLMGRYLATRARDELLELVGSASVWRRRVALVTTQHFIRLGQSADTYRLVDRVLEDPERLIHQAAGWMLREAGKRVSRDELLCYLEQTATRMPRTMLRYALERLEPSTRSALLGLPRTAARPSA